MAKQPRKISILVPLVMMGGVLALTAGGLVFLYIPSKSPAANAPRTRDTVAASAPAGASPNSYAKMFPVDKVCNYPSNSSVAKFRGLGGGTWRHLKVGNTDLGYDCGASEKRIFLPAAGREAFLEYGVIGTADGARSVGFDYDIQIPSSNEAEIRKEFAKLLDEVTKEALNESLPDSVRTKVMDLKTYSGRGERNSEVFTIGDGSLVLSRNADPEPTTFILIKVTICPDKEKPCN